MRINDTKPKTRIETESPKKMTVHSSTPKTFTDRAAGSFQETSITWSDPNFTWNDLNAIWGGFYNLSDVGPKANIYQIKPKVGILPGLSYEDVTVIPSNQGVPMGLLLALTYS